MKSMVYRDQWNHQVLYSLRVFHGAWASPPWVERCESVRKPWRGHQCVYQKSSIESSFITSHTAARWSQTAETHTVMTRKGKCVCVCVYSLSLEDARCWQGSSALSPPLSVANSSLWHLERLIISGSHMDARISSILEPILTLIWSHIWATFLPLCFNFTPD